MTTTTWELRWTAAELPALRDVWTSMAPGLSPSSVVDDDDVYLLTGSTRVNLKLRRRSNALKLKRLDRRSSDGFERWLTDFDEPLPVGRAVAERALTLVRAGHLAEPVSTTTTTDEALEIIADRVAPDRIVEARKRRRLYDLGVGVIDDVRFQVCGSTFRSIGFESASEQALGAFVAELSLERLGTPTNYVQFLDQRG